jgi:3-hydroxyisobutyrate dehydrogenase-like beta-hydroxyacid dehydrogenase
MSTSGAGSARIAMIGFGEAADAIVAGWAERAAGNLAAYDLDAAEPACRPVVAATARGVPCFDKPGPALSDADIVFCLVTADQAFAAAETCAPFIAPGALWLDGNSCAPETKRRSAALIEDSGGRYVDMAIMAPIHPRLHRTPALLSGPHAAAAVAALKALDMNLQCVGHAVGDASTIKMLRSVMIKGIEALTAECLLAARRAGVEDDVLASLQASDPGWNWRQRSSYCLERAAVHGMRRAAEMREVARTLRGLDVPDRMAAATAEWQQELGTLGVARVDDDLAGQLDALLAALP